MLNWRMCLLDRAARAGVAPTPELMEGLLAYLDVLGRWNRRINLTSFSLDQPSEQAADRLIIEPLAAARFVRPDDRRSLDIGSGGGSPAVPLALAAPWLEMTMVEARARKAAFLREVARTLPVALRVECARVEEMLASGRAGEFDLVSFRAVRADHALWAAVDMAMTPRGRVLWFGGKGPEPGGYRTMHGDNRLMVLDRFDRSDSS